MIKKEIPVKVAVLTISRQILRQVPYRPMLPRDDREIIGWFWADIKGIRNGTNICVLVQDLSVGDLAVEDGRMDRRTGRVRGRYGEVVPDHIYVR